MVPVVNLVVYYGEEEWDASKELHEMLDFGKSEETEEILREIVPNYKMNFIDVSKINNTKIYKSDLQTFFEMLQYKQDKNGLVNYIKNHREQLEQIDEDGLDMLGVFLHEEERFDRYRREEGGRQTMCKAIDELFEELINEGRMQAEKKAEEMVKKAQEETQKAQEETQKAQEEIERLQIHVVKTLKEFLPCEAIAERMNLPLERILAI